MASVRLYECQSKNDKNDIGRQRRRIGPCQRSQKCTFDEQRQTMRLLTFGRDHSCPIIPFLHLSTAGAGLGAQQQEHAAARA